MLKRMAVATVLACGALGAYAQTMERTMSTGEFNARGEMSGAALIGTDVRDSSQDTIGEVENVYVDKSGTIREVVVSVGGFLGVGAKHVVVKWNDLQFARDGNSLMLTVNSTEDSLQVKPDHRHQRRREGQSR